MHAAWAENPDAIQRVPSRFMTLGAAAHHLLLGEDNFRMKFVRQPETYRDKVTAVEKPWHNGAGYCKTWNEQQIKAGKVPVTMTELEVIIAMSRSLALEPLIGAGALRGYVEVSGFFRDKETGLWIKVRPDVIPPTDGDFVDLKTASDVTTPALQYSMHAYGYHQQGALVWEACEALGHPFKSFVMAFVETAPPYCARMVPADDDDIGRGRQQNRWSLRKIATAINAKHWPGPGEGDLRPLPIGTDARARIDERLKREGLA
jgi:hypothetical protein